MLALILVACLTVIKADGPYTFQFSVRSLVPTDGFKPYCDDTNGCDYIIRVYFRHQDGSQIVDAEGDSVAGSWSGKKDENEFDNRLHHSRSRSVTEAEANRLMQEGLKILVKVYDNDNDPGSSSSQGGSGDDEMGAHTISLSGKELRTDTDVLKNGLVHISVTPLSLRAEDYYRFFVLRYWVSVFESADAAQHTQFYPLDRNLRVFFHEIRQAGLRSGKLGVCDLVVIKGTQHVAACDYQIEFVPFVGDTPVGTWKVSLPDNQNNVREDHDSTIPVSPGQADRMKSEGFDVEITVWDRGVSFIDPYGNAKLGRTKARVSPSNTHGGWLTAEVSCPWESMCTHFEVKYEIKLD